MCDVVPPLGDTTFDICLNDQARWCLRGVGRLLERQDGRSLLRFAADPPLVRVAEGTPPELVDEAVRVVQLLNMALPRDWQIGFGNEPGAAGTADLASSEIIITFAALEDWPDEVIPPGGPPRAGVSASPCRSWRSTPPVIPSDPGTSRSRAGGSGSIRRAPRATNGWASSPTSSFTCSGAPIPTRHASPTPSWWRARRRRPDVAHPPTPSTGRPSSRSTAESSPAARRTRSTSDLGPIPLRISMACSASPMAKSRSGPLSPMVWYNPGPLARGPAPNSGRIRTSPEPRTGLDVFSASHPRPRLSPGRRACSAP